MEYTFYFVLGRPRSYGVMVPFYLRIIQWTTPYLSFWQTWTDEERQYLVAPPYSMRSNPDEKCSTAYTWQSMYIQLQVGLNLISIKIRRRGYSKHHILDIVLFICHLLCVKKKMQLLKKFILNILWTNWFFKVSVKQ